MGPIKIKTIVPKNRRVEVPLPPEVPEGPVELSITVANTGTETADNNAGWSAILSELRKLRERIPERNIGLSDEVIRMRREEG